MLLLDNSAWARLSSRSLPDERRVEIADLIEGGTSRSAPRSCLKLLVGAQRSAPRPDRR
jgi:hypothetical protein